jgi:hypothetical protein
MPVVDVLDRRRLLQTGFAKPPSSGTILPPEPVHVQALLEAERGRIRVGKLLLQRSRQTMHGALEP